MMRKRILAVLVLTVAGLQAQTDFRFDGVNFKSLYPDELCSFLKTNPKALLVDVLKSTDGWPMFSGDGGWIYFSSPETVLYCLYKIKRTVQLSSNCPHRPKVLRTRASAFQRTTACLFLIKKAGLPFLFTQQQTNIK